MRDWDGGRETEDGGVENDDEVTVGVGLKALKMDTSRDDRRGAAVMTVGWDTTGAGAVGVVEKEEETTADDDDDDGGGAGGGRDVSGDVMCAREGV